jgi:hypothetical protein
MGGRVRRNRKNKWSRGGGILSARSLLEAAFGDGVGVELSTTGRMRAKGPSDALARWLPELKAKRAELEAVLRPVTSSEDWLERLLARPRPDSEPLARWQAHCAGVRRFVEDGWRQKAAALGWPHDELFALRDPFANGSLQGAVWFVGDKTVTAVTADAISLRSASGSTTRIYRNEARRSRPKG